MATRETQKIKPIRIGGELLKRLEAHMAATERSANYVMLKALDKYLPPFKKATK